MPRKRKTPTPPEKQPERTYEDVAKRVQEAVKELNASLEEAADFTGCRVFIQRTNPGDVPGVFACEVYRLTHAVMGFTVEPELKGWTPLVDENGKPRTFQYRAKIVGAEDT